MKIKYVLLPLTFIFVSSYAQNSYSSLTSIKHSCVFNYRTGYDSLKYVNPPSKKASMNDKSRIPIVIEEIKNKIGITLDATVYLTKGIDNASASVFVRDGRVFRELTIDQGFLTNMNKRSGTKWSGISILAHEIGHHLSNFGSNKNNPNPTDHEAELDADYWSGYILQKLGSSKESSTKGMAIFGSERDSDTHPSKYKRFRAIEEGWDDSYNNMPNPDKCDDCLE